MDDRNEVDETGRGRGRDGMMNEEGARRLVVGGWRLGGWRKGGRAGGKVREAKLVVALRVPSDKT